MFISVASGRWEPMANGHMHRLYPTHLRLQYLAHDTLAHCLVAAGFAEVKKRVRTVAGGSTGSVRNLRIREDTAKYLLNLDVNSAHYDPKTRCVSQLFSLHL